MPQELTMKDIHAIVNGPDELRDGSEQPINALGQRQVIQAKSGGFPMHLYHKTLDPVVIHTKKKLQALTNLGYTQTYVPRDFPKHLFRRNMAPNFAEKLDPGTGVPMNLAFVETKEVKNAQEEANLMKQKPSKGVGPWCSSVDSIEPLPEVSIEDKDREIAHLKGQLEALQGQKPA